jgi:hypothetical protein
MEKKYELSDCELVVVFREKLIQIPDYQALLKFLSRDIEARSSVFANAIKVDYLALYHKELDVSNDSMIVEIWGHVFASYSQKQ